MSAALPTGTRGRVLALGLTILAAALLWLTVVAPLLTWHDNLAERLARRQALAARMTAIAATLPELRAQAARGPAGPTRLLPAVSDAIASATVLELVQALAVTAGAALNSAEAIQAETIARQYRRAGVRVALSGDWLSLVRLLQAVDQQTIQLFADDIQIGIGAALVEKDRKLEMSLTVSGLRDGASAP